jgi:tight adherence protein B
VLAVLALGAAVAPKPEPRRAAIGDRSPPRRRRVLDRVERPRLSKHVDPASLAAWCDALARALRGGATLRHALCNVPPPEGTQALFAPALLALERGAPVAVALSQIESSSHDVDVVLVVMRACAEHGGAAAEPIDRAAATLRQRAALAGERRTNSAQARMSALVMTCLPGAMLALLALTSHSVRAGATSSMGLFALALGVALNIAGWGWMRRLIARAT